MMRITKITGELFITIPKSYEKITYQDMKTIFNTYIITDLYYILVQDTTMIYTNLYDMFELINKVDIILTDITIIFLSYTNEDISYVKSNIIIENSLFGNTNNNLYDIINQDKFPKEYLTHDKLFAAFAVSYYNEYYKYISEELKLDVTIIQEAVLSHSPKNYDILEYVPYKLKDDKKFILYWIVFDCRNIRFASDNLKDDEDLIQIVIKNSIRCCFEYFSERLRNKKDIIMMCINQLKLVNCTHNHYNNNILRNISDIHKNDNEIVLPLLKLNGYDLQYASISIKNNKKAVLIAINTSPNALEFASDILKKDKDIVFTAIKLDPTSYDNADEMFFNNKEYILLCLKDNDNQINRNGYDEENYEVFLRYVSIKLRDDKDVVIAAVRKYGNNIIYASNRLKNDKDVVITAINNCYYDIDLQSDNRNFRDDLKRQTQNIDIILNETTLKSKNYVLKQVIKRLKIS